MWVFAWLAATFLLDSLISTNTTTLNTTITTTGSNDLTHTDMSSGSSASSLQNKLDRQRPQVNSMSSEEDMWQPTSKNFQPRYLGPTKDKMTAEQVSIRDAILASRPGTGLSGPFGPWLAVPSIAQPAQTLGKACRYDTSLSRRESELVILLTGAKYISHTEFDIHVGEAIKAGLGLDVIRAIPRDDRFSNEAVSRQLVPLLTDMRERAIVQFTAELLETSKVSDETYAKTKQALDGKDSILVEITSIVGYYAFVSYTLNVFQIPS